jgi:hypothetical protein
LVIYLKTSDVTYMCPDIKGLVTGHIRFVM